MMEGDLGTFLGWGSWGQGGSPATSGSLRAESVRAPASGLRAQASGLRPQPFLRAVFTTVSEMRFDFEAEQRA